MFRSLVRVKNHSKRDLTLCGLILLILILALSIVLQPIASVEPSSPLSSGMTISKTVDSSSPKPGDKINFTIAYSNVMSETARNVTIFEWLPSGLTFVSSQPFYDGVSDPETGFYRWSRGNIPPGGSGTVIVKAMVDNVPVGTVITNTAHLSYENGIRVEVTASVDITVAQAAGVDVYPDQIHSVPPASWSQTEFNLTVTNTGNGLDTFNISLRSVAFNPSASSHDWKIELYNSTGYPTNPVATVYDESQNDPNSWTDHGVLTDVTLAGGESAWFMIKVTEAQGTSGNEEAYLDVQLTATSLFDLGVSDMVDKMTIVKKKAGITFGPDYTKYANPGETVVFRHIIIDSYQTEVVDLNYTSPKGWSYSFWFDNETALRDTDGSGCVDVGVLPKEAPVYILVKVTVPYGTAAGLNDTAVITARGVTSGKFDTATDITIVKSAPILSVEKKLVSGNPSYVGDAVTYQINITNLGNTRLTKIPLDDAFETLSLNFTSTDTPGYTCDEVAGTIHWENITLTPLEPRQNKLVTINFLATAADDIVRESANVIDAEDEFGNWISATYMNTELRIIGLYTLTVTASPTEALGGSFSVSWTWRGLLRDDTFTTPKYLSCDANTIAQVSYPESPIVKGDTRYVFTHYSPSSTVTMNSDKTITLNYRTQYKLTFQQTGSGEPVYITVNGTQLTEALPKSFWVYKGSTTTFSYPSPIMDTAGTTRYVLTGVTGNTTATSVTVNAPTTVVGSYKTQHYLSVITSPAGLDTPRYSGWYDHGAYAQIVVDTPTGGDGVSTRYRFDHWTGTGITNPSSPSTQILMDAPKTATAQFVRQYYITIISAHDDPTPHQWVDEGSSLTASVTSPTETFTGQTQWRCTGYDVDGEVKQGTSHAFENIQAPHRIEFFWVQQFWLQVDTALGGTTVTGTGWYDVGTSASISATTPHQPSPEHRFIFTLWASTGPNEAPITDPRSSSTTVTMNNYYTVQANWQEQWYITVISAHDDPTPSQWVNATGSLDVSVTSPADDDGEGTRYRCTGYRIDGGDLEEGTSYTFVNVQAAHTIGFEWIAQRYLTVEISPSDVPTTIPGEGWYDQDTLVSLTAPSLVSVSEGVRYRFGNWTVDTTTFTDNSITVTMDAPKTATANYVKQFKLTVISAHDSPTPAVGDHWYDKGESITASVSSPADESDGTRYRCTGWAGTGSVPETGTDTSLDFTINAPSSITWNWIAQYRLTINNSGHGVTTPASGNWYDQVTSVTITMGSDTTSNSTETRYLFASWSGSGLGSYSGIANPCQVQMNGPVTETASWTTQHYLTVSSSYGTPGGAGWYDSGSTAYATLDTDTVAGESGVRYVFTHWSEDASGTNYAKSEAITMDAPKTAVANWKTQYYLTVNSSYGAAGGAGWYDSDSTAYATLDTGIVSGGSGVQYVFTQWSGDASGTSYTKSDAITMNAPKTATANWKTQHYLTVNSPYGQPGGTGWYDSGSTAYATLDTDVVSGATGTRYVFTQWSGDSSGTRYTKSDAIIMSSPKTATANWKTQYYLTVKTDPTGLDDPTGQGWYDEGAYAAISVDTPTGGDSVSMRYRFLNWTGTDVADAAAASTTILMDAPKEAKAFFIQQFYLTMSTNLGTVTPDSGWYDVGSIVSIEAFAPEVVEGQGYVWHGWTGTGEKSYSGFDNPATATMNSAVSETAHWKINPTLTIMISNDTIASGDKIFVYGRSLPVSSSAEISIIYMLPNGTEIEHVVYTDDEGYYEDVLLLGNGCLYSLFVDAGEWLIIASRPGDLSHETVEESTRLEIGAPSIVQIHPALLAALILAGALIAYVLLMKKVKNNKNTWWRATVVLCCVGVLFGVASLALDWVFVAGSATLEDVTYQVNVLLYPFSSGLVSITEGIRYVGAIVPSMIDPTWQNISGSPGPVMTLWLIPVGCSLLLLAGLYKPKNERQRIFKVAILVISGAFIIASVVQGLAFVQGQVSALEGAGTGYGAGVYLAIVSGTLTLLSGLFAYRETIVKPPKAKTP